ncbi:MAG: hypothetical protein ACRDGT_12075 [Candidatus Limnocylindria bacterium]
MGDGVGVGVGVAGLTATVDVAVGDGEPGAATGGALGPPQAAATNTRKRK